MVSADSPDFRGGALEEGGGLRGIWEGASHRNTTPQRIGAEDTPLPYGFGPAAIRLSRITALQHCTGEGGKILRCAQDDGLPEADQPHAAEAT